MDNAYSRVAFALVTLFSIVNFCSDGFQSFNGKSYKFFPDNKSWNEARRICQSFAVVNLLFFESIVFTSNVRGT